MSATAYRWKARRRPYLGGPGRKKLEGTALAPGLQRAFCVNEGGTKPSVYYRVPACWSFLLTSVQCVGKLERDLDREKRGCKGKARDKAGKILFTTFT